MTQIRTSAAPRWGAAMTMCVLAALVGHADAGMIQSSPFSLGYGYIDPDGSGMENPLPASWNTSETSAVNTPTVQGDFSFTPAPSGSGISNRGPLFTNRVLTTTTDNNFVGSSTNFTASISAAYIGSLPITPETYLEIRISSIRIWAMGSGTFDPNDPRTISFVELTPGHAAMSPPQTLHATATSTSLFRTATNYDQLSWDPADFLTPGVSFTRTFALSAFAERGIDGFEIFGTVILWTPEPASALLLLPGLILLSRRCGHRVP